MQTTSKQSDRLVLVFSNNQNRVPQDKTTTYCLRLKLLQYEKTKKTCNCSCQAALQGLLFPSLQSNCSCLRAAPWLQTMSSSWEEKDKHKLHSTDSCMRKSATTCRRITTKHTLELHPLPKINTHTQNFNKHLCFTTSWMCWPVQSTECIWPSPHGCHRPRHEGTTQL